MDRKYQVFISSTYEDLKEHRNQVIKAVLEMGHIPVGMEMFSAGDEQQWEIIKRQIDQIDYYVVIIACRYGSMIGEISYTEREYDYAIGAGIPVLGFILQDDAGWPTDHKENNKDIIKRLEAFKAKVSSKMCSLWKNEDDLYGKCCIALMKAFQSYPREGWVKGSAAETSDMLLEITRLSKENRELRLELASRKNEIISEGRAEIDNIINALRINKRKFSIYEREGLDWKRLPDTTLLRIYESMAPELINESDENKMMHTVAFEISNQQNLRQRSPVPTNYFRSWMGDLTSLNLVSPSEKRHSVHDEKKYWTLTPLGREVHASIRRNELMKGLASAEEAEGEDEVPF